MAIKAKDILVANGYDVILTRYTQTDIVSNKLRAVMANEVNADLVVPIHWNGGGGHGPALVIPPDYASRPWKSTCDNVWSIIGPKLAAHLGASVHSSVETVTAFFGLVQVPTVYVETGFADSSDINKLVGEENHQAIAQAIAEGIMEFYE